jgi:hypothetical protein
MKNQFLGFLNHPAYGILVQWPDRSKTWPNFSQGLHVTGKQTDKYTNRTRQICHLSQKQMDDRLLSSIHQPTHHRKDTWLEQLPCLQPFSIPCTNSDPLPRCACHSRALAKVILSIRPWGVKGTAEAKHGEACLYVIPAIWEMKAGGLRFEDSWDKVSWDSISKPSQVLMAHTCSFQLLGKQG